MSNQLTRRSSRPQAMRQPQYGRSSGALDSFGGVVRDIISEYQRAKRRSQMMSFFLGVLACLSLWLFGQNLNRTPDIAQQPVIYRFDDDLLQPISTTRRKAPRPARKPKDRSEPLQPEWR